MVKSPLNIIISGLGGQGVYTLTKVIWKICELNHIKVQSSIFKGGAQKHGSVHAVLRIFVKEQNNYNLYSTQIPEGELDLIIGLEAWETLRYKRYFGSRTKIFMNSQITPFHIERIEAFNKKNPVKYILDLGLETILKDFLKESKLLFSTAKMVNFLIGLEVFKSGALLFNINIDDYVKILCNQIKADKKLKTQIIKVAQSSVE